jgi:hypothetical protein
MSRSAFRVATFSACVIGFVGSVLTNGLRLWNWDCVICGHLWGSAQAWSEQSLLPVSTAHLFGQPCAWHSKSLASGSAGFVFQESSAMIFALNDFCEVAWLDNPFKVGQKSPAVFAVDLACQKL